MNNKRIETEHFVLEFKEPEKVKAVAIGFKIKASEDKNLGGGGVIGGFIDCVESVERCVAAIVKQWLNDGLTEDGITTGLAMIGANAMDIAKSKKLVEVDNMAKAEKELN